MFRLLLRLRASWTHVIATSPLSKLAEAVRSFPETLASMEGLAAVPEFHSKNYTAEWAATHADAVKRAVASLLQWLLGNLAVPPLHDGMSVRELLNAVNAAGFPLSEKQADQLNECLKTMVDQAWNRSFSLVACVYPGTVLRKYVWRDSSHTGTFLACAPNPAGPGLVPQVVLRSVRSDLRVEVATAT